jgi:hypothetical protein
MGTSRTIIKDQETGKTEVVYECRRTSLQYWVTIIGSIIGIAVVVFAAARFGVVIEAKQAIEYEMQPPTGLIFMGVEKCVKEELEPLKEQAIIMNVRQEMIVGDIGEIKDAIKEIARNDHGP